VVLLRLHPFVRDALVIPEGMGDFAVDASGLPDINELMLVSDVLVTDYSSSIYEFALLGRPIVLFAPDHDRYVNERGFYFDDYVAGVPGPVVETTEELGDVIARGEFDLDRVRAFAAESFDVADGTATRRFVDEVILPRVTP
jgi:CDP-glycerol glycerophosphotransferase (TagB/SpsB family)